MYTLTPIPSAIRESPPCCGLVKHDRFHALLVVQRARRRQFFLALPVLQKRRPAARPGMPRQGAIV